MGKIKRKFDLQFKIQLCQAIENNMMTVADICREHQLQRPLVEGWLAKYISGAMEKESPTKTRALEREIEKLRAKVGEQAMVIDLLKKMDHWKRQQKSGRSFMITSQNLAQLQKPAEPPASPFPATTTNRKKTK